MTMAMSSASDRRPRLYMLDGLRGICALGVMVYHFCMWNQILLPQLGTFGVYLFYVLSGFSLWYVYALSPVTEVSLKQFFIARVARLWPLYAAVGLLVFAAKWIAMGSAAVLNMEFLHRFLLNITFLFGLVDPGKTSHTPGGWSIGVEWVFYLAFPLFLLFARRLKVTLAILIISALYNQLYTGLLLSSGNLETQWVAYIQAPTFLVYFVAGIAAAQLYRQWQLHPKLNTPFFRQGLARLVPLSCLALIFFYPTSSAEDYLVGWHCYLLVAAAMAALFFGSLLSEPTHFEHKLYAFLGDISYSAYLLHFYVYQAVSRLMAKFYPTPNLFPVFFVAAVVTLLVAYCSYRFFEAPARRYLNRKLGHHA